MLLIVGITFLSFLLIYHSPGDPATVALKKAGMRVSEEAVEQKREELGLNDPFLVQYGRWLYSFSHGDLGDSYKTGKPVADELKKNDSGNAAFDGDGACSNDSDRISTWRFVCKT